MKKTIFTLIFILGITNFLLAQNSIKKITIAKETEMKIKNKTYDTLKNVSFQNKKSKNIKINLQKEYFPVLHNVNAIEESTLNNNIIIFKKSVTVSKNMKSIKQ